MADEQQTPRANKLRKLRKKLRQIENLQRLHGLRELTDEEVFKVNQRDAIREELQDLLSLALDDEHEEKSDTMDEKPSVEEKTNNVDDDDDDDNKDDIVAQEKKLAQQEEDISEEMLENANDNDVVMQLESNSQEPIENSIDEKAKEALQQAAVNETDDSKAKKAGKRKGSKRKVDGAKQWEQMQFAVTVIEGHHHPICAVDSDKEVIVSGGHDTSLKIWNATSFGEIFSLGGHTGSISAVLLISEDIVVTGSQDCSVRFWNVKTGASLSSIYVYSPVTCLAYNDNQLLAIGNEGGKIDIYDTEKEATTISTKVFDESLVSLTFMHDGKIACASADGVVKTFEITGNELTQVADSYDDVTSISSLKNDIDAADTPNTSLLNLPLRKINCISNFNDTVFWGDDGYNVKAFETTTGKVIKLRNNLHEYSPTDSLAVLKDGSNGYLFSAGFDVDTGSGYINVRKLPEMAYLGTISDRSLGHVSCISASIIDGNIQMITGGSELRVWNQSTNGKKRRASEEVPDVVPCKFVCAYNKAVDSEEEEESDSEAEDDNESGEVTTEENIEGKKSYCIIL